MSEQPNAQPTPAAENALDENKLIAERRAKLTALRGQGVAFPNDAKREHYAGDLQAEFADAERWTAEALKPHELRLEGEPGGERIGDLVELVVWSGPEVAAAWASASLAPSFSLRVLDPGGAGP